MAYTQRRTRNTTKKRNLPTTSIEPHAHKQTQPRHGDPFVLFGIASLFSFGVSIERDFWSFASDLLWLAGSW